MALPTNSLNPEASFIGGNIPASEAIDNYIREHSMPKTPTDDKTETISLRVPKELADALQGFDTVAVLKDFLRKNAADRRAKSGQNTPMLHKANDLINGERQTDYGDKLENFAQIAMGFQMILARKLQAHVTITAEDVALCMMQVKAARLTMSPAHFDSILDIAGYAGCYAVIQEERNNNKTLPGAIRDAR